VNNNKLQGTTPPQLNGKGRLRFGPVTIVDVDVSLNPVDLQKQAILKSHRSLRG
jgi:hypothetical protein